MFQGDAKFMSDTILLLLKLTWICALREKNINMLLEVQSYHEVLSYQARKNFHKGLFVLAYHRTLI